ncbi:hypothetical protein BV20DRAFT_983397 [Pilatotrama ljubarskyi]|nr:hypothetical protein BV20DRAFT_983397 [Pilatotrama ljubarskyi]
MELSLSEVSVITLLAFCLYAMWNLRSKRNLSTRPTVYTFSARTPIAHGQTTYLEFAAPSAPGRDTTCSPTILKVLDAQRPPFSVRASTPESGGRSSTPSTLTFSDRDADDAKRISPKLEPDHRVQGAKTFTSRTPPLRIQLLSQLPQDDKSSATASNTRRITRSGSRSSIASTSASTFAARPADPSDDIDGSQSELPYHKRQTKPHTAWFSSEGERPITYPPLMRNQHEVRLGDVFCHKTPEASQLWVWEATERGSCWREARVGYERPDGRRLSITDKKREPSWVGPEWCSKRISASTFVFEEATMRSTGAGKNVRFETGEASFSEPASGHDSKPRRYRPLPPRSTNSKFTPIHIILSSSFLVLAALLVYMPVDMRLPDSVHLLGFTALERRFNPTWLSGLGRSSATTAQHTLPSDFCRDVAREAAILARWGPVLHPDFALRAVGGRITQSLTSPPERSRSRSPERNIGPEVVIDEDLTIGRCWTTAATSVDWYLDMTNQPNEVNNQKHQSDHFGII